MIHYPFDFIVIIIVALIFYYIGTTSSFESVYFRRATRINTKMRESLNNESKSSQNILKCSAIYDFNTHINQPLISTSWLVLLKMGYK